MCLICGRGEEGENLFIRKHNKRHRKPRREGEKALIVNLDVIVALLVVGSVAIILLLD